jgi:hypothetical protein
MLPDGTRMRPISATDKALLQAGMARLSPASAYHRFLSGKPRLTQTELRYLTEIDGCDHIALVVLDDHDELVAVGRLVRDDVRLDTAELAVTVGDCWQRRGIGRTLAHELTRAMGVDHVRGTMLASNHAALRLMRGLGPVERSAIASGVRELVVGVRAPVALAV